MSTTISDADIDSRFWTENLDLAQSFIVDGCVPQGMAHLATVTFHYRQQQSNVVWNQVIDFIRSHPISDLLRQDPFTARSFHKPRGYSGDAVLLDLIYGMGEAEFQLSSTSTLGRAIHQYAVNRYAPQAVRWRCEYIARVIDETAERCPNLRVLSVASGHIREVCHSKALMAGRISELVALDSDGESLAEACRSFPQVPLSIIHGNITQLFKQPIGTFDLIYSLGLLDYLDRRAAKRLIGQLKKMLNPRGRLVLANFAHNLPDIGYMEAFMDWHLIYRDEGEFQALADCSHLESAKTFRDPSGVLLMLEVVNNAARR